VFVRLTACCTILNALCESISDFIHIELQSETSGAPRPLEPEDRCIDSHTLDYIVNRLTDPLSLRFNNSAGAGSKWKPLPRVH